MGLLQSKLKKVGIITKDIVTYTAGWPNDPSVKLGL